MHNMLTFGLILFCRCCMGALGIRSWEKLGGLGSKARKDKNMGQEFLGQMSTLFGYCVHCKDVRAQRGKTLLKLKHYIWKPQICLLFSIWKGKMSQIYVLSCKNDV